MSATAHPYPPAAAPRARPILGAACALALSLMGACTSNDGGANYRNPDGSFGEPAGPSRDGGLDGSSWRGDSAWGSTPQVLVRFVHAIPNLGLLLVCYDPDGPGPVAPDVLRQDHDLLQADYGTRSDSLLLPALTSGALTLQRVGISDAGLPFDSGALDGGAALDPCDPSLREATIPLPITPAWLDPSAPPSTDQLAALDLLTTVSNASAVTLLGSGVALNQMALDDRTDSTRAKWLASHPGGSLDQADAAAGALRDDLVATFGARALIQLDRPAPDAGTFALSVFHAIPDVAPADDTLADMEIGAVRLCVTAGSLDNGVLPKPPAAGVPFRVRTQVGSNFQPGINYDFRVFAEGAFDSKSQDCSTTSLAPIAKTSYANFAAGHSYTLALFGVVAPVALCSANDVSIARASCSRPASELGARIDVLVD